jgi:hypothetical protein
MIGTSFPYINYLPNPGHARGIQIDIKPEKSSLCYHVEWIASRFKVNIILVTSTFVSKT